MKRAFILNGPGKSGKNTLIKIVRLYLRSHQIPVYSYSSIFPIKDFIFKNGSWDGITKDDAARTLMVKTKQHMVADGDKPLQYLLNSFKSHEPGLFFFHIREAAELSKCVQTFAEKLGEQVKTIHLERIDPSLTEFNSGVDLKSQTMEYKHYDYILVNDAVGLTHFAHMVHTSFLLKEFPELQFSAFENKLLHDDELHQQFDDELKAGYA